MASSLSNLFKNLVEGIHKNEHRDKKYETFRIKYKDYELFLEFTNFRDDLIEYK